MSAKEIVLKVAVFVVLVVCMIFCKPNQDETNEEDWRGED